jgi:hypothetical protein
VQVRLSAAIHESVGSSRLTKATDFGEKSAAELTPLKVPQKGYTLAASSVSPFRRFPEMAGFRVRAAGLIGTLVAIATVVGSSKSF